MSHATFFKSSIVPRAAVRAAKQKDAKRTQQQVYIHVERRDEMRCRACGRRLRKTVSMDQDQLHHHHHPYRSQGGASHSADVLLLCRACHDDVHVTRALVIEGPSCDRLLTFTRNGKKWTS